jgi:eukaryotic-like serine/threonine-protein kinase
MGEVWKARDTRLDRVVAIKISKAQFSDRFHREAQAIAVLNHPHICHLYDVGPDYLVMEYVEGTTLKGPLPVHKAVEFASQILSALDAAHRSGIIHRDLKPANILVTKRNGIKLLDFGLARIASGSADATLTQPGEKMGTPAYMAPEQWEGKPGDARTDIYCFGCVLYEMLTGRRAAQEDRVPVESKLLDTIVRTCMEPAPDDRWQSAFDIFRAMTLPVPAAPKPSRIWPFPAAMAALIAIGGALMIKAWLAHAPGAGESVTFAIYPPQKTTFSNSLNVTANVPQFALAPDGGTIVFCAAAEGERPSVWRRPLNDITAQRVPGTEDAQDPFWSPDGRWIGFFAEGKLKKVPAEGGAVQVIVSSVRDERGATWAQDDTILFASGTDSLQRVAATGGQQIAVNRLEAGDASHRYPQFLPDSRHFLYLRRSISGQNAVFAASLSDGTRKLIAPMDSSALYVRPGYLLLTQGDSLLGQVFDAEHLQLRGEPFLVAEHVGRTSTWKSAISTSNAGTIAYANMLAPQGSLTWFDRAGRRLQSIGSEGYYTDFRLSPNGKLLAFSLLDAKRGVIDVWITDLARDSTSRISTESASINATPIWSPDGAQLIFRSSRHVVEFYQRSAAGGGDERMLSSFQMMRAAGIQSTMLINTDWSPDGKNIIFSAPNPSSGTDLWLFPLTADTKPVRLLASPADEMHGNFSPDGHLVAYTSNESGKFQVVVQTLPLSDEKWPVSTTGGYEPRWRADGREIYYLSEDRKLMAVAVGPGPSFSVPKVLFQTRVPAGVTPNRTHFVPSRDGQRFLVNTESTDVSPASITVVTNWAARLKR